MRVVFDTNVLVLYLMGEPATSIVDMKLLSLVFQLYQGIEILSPTRFYQTLFE